MKITVKKLADLLSPPRRHPLPSPIMQGYRHIPRRTAPHSRPRAAMTGADISSARSVVSGYAYKSG